MPHAMAPFPLASGPAGAAPLARGADRRAVTGSLHVLICR